MTTSIPIIDEIASDNIRVVCFSLEEISRIGVEDSVVVLISCNKYQKRFIIENVKKFLKEDYQELSPADWNGYGKCRDTLILNFVKKVGERYGKLQPLVLFPQAPGAFKYERFWYWKHLFKDYQAISYRTLHFSQRALQKEILQDIVDRGDLTMLRGDWNESVEREILSGATSVTVDTIMSGVKTIYQNNKGVLANEQTSSPTNW